jgi:hypothetical protein
MLRALVLLLVLANAGFFAWSHGWLQTLGAGPTSSAEPQRMAQQIKPESMRLLTVTDVRELDTAAALPTNPAAPGLNTAAAPGNTECLQAGVFTDEQAGALRSRLQAALPPGSWTLASVTEPGRWLVFMGRFNNDEAMAIKRGELSRLGVPYQALSTPALGAGLSLGAFSVQADAERELARLGGKGVRSARVVQDKVELRGELLTLPVVDAALKAQLEGIKVQLVGKVLQGCR